MIWKKQVSEQCMKDGLSRDGFCPSKWIVGVNQIASRMASIRPHSAVGNTVRFKTVLSAISSDW